MRFAIVFTLAAAVVSTSASLVVRQTSPPACYFTCAAKANIGSCAATDVACLCKDPSFVSSTTQCLVQTCSAADLPAAINTGYSTCLAVGVTLTSSATASGTGASASSTGAAASTTGAAASTTDTTSSSESSSTSASAPATTSSSAATAHGVNAFIGLAAVGLVAIAL